jgi:hypothetical protein
MNFKKLFSDVVWGLRYPRSQLSNWLYDLRGGRPPSGLWLELASRRGSRCGICGVPIEKGNRSVVEAYSKKNGSLVSRKHFCTGRNCSSQYTIECIGKGYETRGRIYV